MSRKVFELPRFAQFHCKLWKIYRKGNICHAALNLSLTLNRKSTPFGSTDFLKKKSTSFNVWDQQVSICNLQLFWSRSVIFYCICIVFYIVLWLRYFIIPLRFAGLLLFVCHQVQCSIFNRNCRYNTTKVSWSIQILFIEVYHFD